MPNKNLLVFAILSALFQLLSVHQTTAQTAEALDYKERFVLQAVRTVHGAQMTYQATAGAGTYGSFEQLRQTNLIDAVLAGGEKYGYHFVLATDAPTATTPARFRLTATPKDYPKRGRRSFFIDEYGELRGADKGGALADANDPVISNCASMGVFSTERCVLTEMRTLHGAQITYQATIGAGTFGTFVQLRQAGLISAGMAAGTSHGYHFALVTFAPTAGTPAFFTVQAVPVAYGGTTVRSFYIDPDGVIRGGDKQGAAADRDDPPIPD